MQHYKHFQNKQCEYFPCHKNVNVEDFNCLFCYCPLYMLKNHCGGNFKNNHGVKDCSGCTIPHNKNSYETIISKMPIVLDIGSKFTDKLE